MRERSEQSYAGTKPTIACGNEANNRMRERNVTLLQNVLFMQNMSNLKLLTGIKIRYKKEKTLFLRSAQWFLLHVPKHMRQNQKNGIAQFSFQTSGWIPMTCERRCLTVIASYRLSVSDPTTSDVLSVIASCQPLQCAL
jgi:hypothetical protein